MAERRSRRGAAIAQAADLGMIVSDRLYNDAIEDGALINPDAYRRMRITCKETRTYAWVWFPPVSNR